MRTEPIDRRVERTRSAILAAFRALLFSKGFDGVDVRDVAIEANVGRSTFYKHFRNKEDVLIQSLEPLLASMVEACVSRSEPEALALVAGHFWDNRRLARVVFSGRSMILIVRSLSGAIEQRLSDLLGAKAFVVPVQLVAGQLASAQMSLLDDWLRGRGASSANAIANVLHRTSFASVQAALRTS